ncbi:MAG TPA: PilZ domain-containing protein [Nitrospira sp.]|nr:PilZ domain-containing protein [Nitrospira sp.]
MDLRRYQRFPVRLQSVLSGLSRNEWPGTVVDLSKGGCRIETNAQVYAGMQVSLRLEVAGEASPILVARAGVRWNRPNLVGVGFMSVESPHQERLNQILQRLKQDSKS